MVYLWLALGLVMTCLTLYVGLVWWIRHNLQAILPYDDLEEAEHRAEADAWLTTHQ